MTYQNSYHLLYTTLLLLLLCNAAHTSLACLPHLLFVVTQTGTYSDSLWYAGVGGYINTLCLRALSSAPAVEYVCMS